MTQATPPTPPDHLHFFNHHTGRARFHFDEAPPPAPPPPAAPPAPVWHTGLDAEMIGHAQNKGWKLDDPKEAFSAAAKVARDLERHFGAPADRIVKIPAADAKPEDLRSFYERLGAPKEAKDYDLSAVKDQSIADTLRATVHEAGLSKAAAAAVATSVAKALESKATTQTTLNDGKVAEERAALRANWADKYDYNHLQAIEGARRLGISKEGVNALEGQIGYAAVMEAMRKIGASSRDDTFEGSGAPRGDVVTMESAIARRAELKADKAWTGRYLAGGVAERREMDRLNQMITGVVA
jgi:hypothetical protein